LFKNTQVKMSNWFDTLRDGVQKVYELINNDEAIGESLSEFAYTVQTGYPRYILNNFSFRDLEKFLDNPQIDSFFVIIRKTENGLMYGLVYKSPTKGWRVSTVKFGTQITSISLREFITEKRDSDSHNSLYVNDYNVYEPKILSEDEEFEYYEEDDEELMAKDEKILLLRPKTGSFSCENTRKRISHYESIESSFCDSSKKIDTEKYIFDDLLAQPEYLDKEHFKYIRKLIYNSLVNESNNEAAKYCKQISVLFSESFKAYRVGLLI